MWITFNFISIHFFLISMTNLTHKVQSKKCRLSNKINMHNYHKRFIYAYLHYARICLMLRICIWQTPCNLNNSHIIEPDRSVDQSYCNGYVRVPIIAVDSNETSLPYKMLFYGICKIDHETRLKGPTYYAITLHKLCKWLKADINEIFWCYWTDQARARGLVCPSSHNCVSGWHEQV